ncbi:unnamed protein product [Psylliodes chrysocephalus]|uniref:Uncharacterized protein n=1 Tax=Psylliodes chrysocephalus TaxID=3402493 RepID=A0A9P0CZQ8_9CUCU|nr:unnamed protein product [Psylliodes chrysocephala]
MQRILSVEIGKNIFESSEYITKRLCCSVVLTVTFLSMIAGFFLGKFVSDKTNSHYGIDFQELAKKVDILNNNFQQTFHVGYNNISLHPYNDIHFLKCNFSTIGQNDSGQLTATNYLKMLNNCFDIG